MRKDIGDDYIDWGIDSGICLSLDTRKQISEVYASTFID